MTDDQPTEEFARRDPRRDAPTERFAPPDPPTVRFPQPGQPTEAFETREFDAPIATAPRRFPVWPVVVGVLAAALVIVTVVLVVTLNRPAPVAAPTSPTPTPAPSTSAPAEPAPLPPPPAPRPEAGPNECIDALGDAGAIDLDRVALDADDDDVTARFVLTSTLPAGESGIGLYAESRNGHAAYQLGVAFDGGAVDRYFIWDGEEENDLDTDAVRVDGSTVTIEFPRDALDELDKNWSWYGFATAAGSPLDACPGTEDAPELLPFDRNQD